MAGRPADPLRGVPGSNFEAFVGGTGRTGVAPSGGLARFRTPRLPRGGCITLEQYRAWERGEDHLAAALYDELGPL